MSHSSFLSDLKDILQGDEKETICVLKRLVSGWEKQCMWSANNFLLIWMLQTHLAFHSFATLSGLGKYFGYSTNIGQIYESEGQRQSLFQILFTSDAPIYNVTEMIGNVIGCHLCNKFSREISSLLNIPQSTVSGIITKWKRLGTTATQPRSGRPRKMTERGQRMLRRIVHRGRQLSAEPIATDPQT